jgi:hypothetical protein
MPPISGCGSDTFACQATQDECASDDDCTVGEKCFVGGGMRYCATLGCQTGRPFLVDGACRTADAESRTDWATSAFAPSVNGLTARDRRRLADSWTRIALMEHASIAAFARFTLELLWLGAPPELVEASHRALSDETEHARLAFALASVYGGSPVGPGPLDLHGALDGVDALGIVRRAITEGCIGETVAATEAEEALEHATDPAVRAVLARIAADERRHAELAWRFVAWALESGRLEHRAAARIALEETLDGYDDSSRDPTGSRAESGGADEVGDERFLRYGVLPDSLRREVASAALAGMVRPCAAALLARSVGAIRAA